MGYPFKSVEKIMITYLTFQFPLWDTQLTIQTNTFILPTYFQFPLWDT